MNNKYRLLRDCPHGKAGSVWEEHNGIFSSDTSVICLFNDHIGHGRCGVWFPLSTFSDWFEPIVEMPKFTKEQAREIGKHAPVTCNHTAFDIWLFENTET